jgi:hypothetical protein
LILRDSSCHPITESGTPVDIDRASFLMDAELWRHTLAALQQAAPNPNDAAQWAWDYYCERHLEKYDEYFGPDVIPGRDQPKTPLPEKPIDLGSQPERFVRVLGAGRKSRP